MKKLLARLRERSRQKMAREYPVSAWVSQFDTVEELQAALERREGPSD